jgi:LDH2 family malate/lactate/ureidoglycolate dehydrogenase
LGSWILTGLLSGAWRTNPMPDRILGGTSETKNGFAQEGIGHMFAAVRLDHFGNPDLIKRGLASMIQTLNQSPPAPGVERVLVPGQKEAEIFQRRAAEGIPLSESTWADLRGLSEQFEIPLPS